MTEPITTRPPEPHSERRAISVRLAAYYTANFAKGGVQFPWWQVFLEGRGFSAPEIGWLMGIRFWVGFLSGPVVGQFADKWGERRRIMGFIYWLAVSGRLRELVFWLRFFRRQLVPWGIRSP